MSHDREFKDVAYVCPLCSRRFEGRRSFGTHLGRSHADYGGAKRYVLERQLSNVPPTCLCGCGQLVSWSVQKHRYVDYVSGHNDTGFDISAHVKTPEQRRRNVESVKKTYAAKSAEISSKISSGVKKALAESSFDFSKHAVEMWSKQEHVEKVRAAQRLSWQGTRGKTRRAKVFTPEFGRKISVANATREHQKISKEESSFVEHLKKVFGEQYVQSRWLNLEERAFKADAYLVDHDVYVEFDGVYWHGLDRESDWDANQIRSITNDFDKNLLARQGRFNLVRVRSDVAVDSITSYDTLLDAAYHVAINGTVVKEGTVRLRDDRCAIVSRDSLLAVQLGKEGHVAKEFLEREMLPLLTKFLRLHVKYWGWFYPTTNETKEEALAKLSARSILEDCSFSTGSNVGTSFLKSRFKSYWDVDGGPVKAFHDVKSLDSVVRYRIGLNDSKKYEYATRDGSKVTCNETFDVSLYNVRRGFIVQRKAVSFFRPSLACDVYSYFLNDVDEPIVWDPSAGFGARMLGFAAALRGRKGRYFANEPASATYADALVLAEELRDDRLIINVSNSGSENAALHDNLFDLVFTSPPYFDVEKYYDEPGQCWRDYPTFDSWLNGYLRKTYENAYRCLKPGAKMVINFDKKCSAAAMEVAKSVGFSLERSLDLQVSRDHFGRARSSSYTPRIERLDVFVKS